MQHPPRGSRPSKRLHQVEEAAELRRELRLDDAGPVSATDPNAPASIRAAPCTTRSILPKRAMAASTAARTCCAVVHVGVDAPAPRRARLHARPAAGAASRRSAGVVGSSLARPLSGGRQRRAADAAPAARPAGRTALGQGHAHVAQSAGHHDDGLLRQIRRRRSPRDRHRLVGLGEAAAAAQRQRRFRRARRELGDERTRARRGRRRRRGGPLAVRDAPAA